MTLIAADAAGVLHRPARPGSAKPARTPSRPTATPSDCCCSFAHGSTGKPPVAAGLGRPRRDTIAAFLDHLEADRHNSAGPATLRLTAIRSLFAYAALRHPEHAALDPARAGHPAQALRQAHRHLPHHPEVEALLAAPDRSRWEGRRDHAMLPSPSRPACASPNSSASTAATSRSAPAPTSAATAKAESNAPSRSPTRVKPSLADWLAERVGPPADPLFPTRTGRRLSRDAVAQRVSTHAKTAAATSPSLATKYLHPHVLRHTCAMSLLQAGVDTTVIALWLDTPASAPPTPTSTPTSPSRRKPSRSSPRHRHARPLPAPRQLLAFLESL